MDEARRKLTSNRGIRIKPKVFFKKILFPVALLFSQPS